MEHHDSAIALAQQLKKAGHAQPAFKAYTKQLFEDQFNFPEIANHIYAVQQLQNLEIAQSDFNQNPDNDKLLRKFVNMA